MKEPSLAEALIHDLPRDFDPPDPWSKHRVLGYRLRPFCHWHIFLLEQIESPILVTGSPDSMEDLLRAVRICRLRFREFDPGISGWSLRAFWSSLGRRSREKQLHAFSEYIRDFQTGPEYRIIPPEQKSGHRPPSRKGSPPAVLEIIRKVISETRCSYREAWEMPAGEARWHYAMSLQEHCELDFMTEERKTQEERFLKSWEETDPESLKKALEVARRFN